MPIERETSGTLADVIDRILDKGLIINADIAVSVVGVELLTLRIRAALASFETAARYGLEFPSGTALPVSVQPEALLARNGHQHAPIARPRARRGRHGGESR